MISVIGSAGSIGRQTLDVMRHLRLPCTALASGRDYKTLELQAREFKPLIAALRDETAAKLLKTALADTDITVLSGEGGIEEAAVNGQTALLAASGFAGLKPALAAVRAGRRIALANKETLVAAGSLFMEEVRKYGAELIPVDSEHSAIFQCIDGAKSKPKKLYITASGGPFFGKSTDELKNVTASDALRHPKWQMGAKITIDSATMMNKGLEVIEAMHLFSVGANNIEVLVHPQSIVHSMAGFEDGSVIAQMALPDMRIPIQYALCYPERTVSPVKPPDFTALRELTFFEPDMETFKCLPLAYEAARNGDACCCVMNAANEAAVSLFLEGNTGFLDIYALVRDALDVYGGNSAGSFAEIEELDRLARRHVYAKIQEGV